MKTLSFLFSPQKAEMLIKFGFYRFLVKALIKGLWLESLLISVFTREKKKGEIQNDD